MTEVKARSWVSKGRSEVITYKKIFLNTGGYEHEFPVQKTTEV